MKKLGLYLHLPFCVKKCLYCDFCSFPKPDAELISSYVDALCRDIEGYADRCSEYSVDTVYFGGGTPTLLPIREFEKLFSSIEKSFSVEDNAEISSECNPATADREYLFGLRSLGVNRLSIGLQSANDNELRALGRIHTYDDFVTLYRNARGAGFENISVDLMYGIPEQTMNSFKKTLFELVKLAPEHISAYGLKIEEETPFGKMSDRLILPDEDIEYEMYVTCTNYLLQSGYAKYEISNFARADFESRHNIKYWKGDDYIGFGVSAHSYFEGVRYSNSRGINGYIAGADITDEKRKIPPSEQMTEYTMLGMRMSSGVDVLEFKKRFGVDFDSVYGEKLKKYIDGGYVLTNEKSRAFSDKGFWVSNFILSDILEF